jgi:DNA-binding IclR family transcriptional regulator
MQSYKTLKDFSKILALFNDLEVEALGVTEISKSLQMTPSKVSRMLGTLEREGLFERHAKTGKYQLGVFFFELGLVSAYHFPLHKIVRPHLEQMAEETKLTASCAMLKNNRVIIIDRVQAFKAELLTHSIGLNLPIHSTATGKILLAYCSEAEQEEILYSKDLIRFTDTTAVEPELIKKNLKIFRQNGYATDKGETHQDFSCIAAPVWNSAGKVIAAINLMGEKRQARLETLLEYADYLKQKALFISRQLGYQ